MATASGILGAQFLARRPRNLDIIFQTGWTAIVQPSLVGLGRTIEILTIIMKTHIGKIGRRSVLPDGHQLANGHHLNDGDRLSPAPAGRAILGVFVVSACDYHIFQHSS
jgi:hypothetical protein